MKQFINNKIYYIFLFFLFSVCFHTGLFSDLNSVSPTINDHIYISEWSSAGLENGGLDAYFPEVGGTLYVPASTDTPSVDLMNITTKISQAYDLAHEYKTIWSVQLAPSSEGIYEIEGTITMKDSVILAGPHLWKSDKDEGNRAIIEFEMSSPSKNCIEFDNLTLAGIEDVYLKRIDAGETTGIDHGVTIYMNNCNNCFVSGVQSWYPVCHHVSLRKCDNIEVRGCYFQGANNHGTGGQGYGVVCTQSEYCLIEDNIFTTLRHSMLVQDTSAYNVFGYNFSQNQYHTSLPSYISCLAPTDFVGDMVCHGHPSDYQTGPTKNLFEGNKGGFIWVDLFHWFNREDNTFIRNSADNYGYLVSWQPYNQNFVANYLKCVHWFLCNICGFPRSTMFLIDEFPYIGPLSTPSLFCESSSRIKYTDFWGKIKTKTITMNGDLKIRDNFTYYDTWQQDSSYYHNEKPSFFAESSTWPFDPTLDKNSAERRYVSGYKRTVSRHDPFDIVTYYLNDDLVFPDEIPSNIDPSWILSDHIEVPKGAALYIPAGTTLQFAPDTYMVIRGHLLADGTEDDEIIFSGIDNGEWDGLCFGNYGEYTGIKFSTSKLNYCTIKDINNTHYNGFNPGAPKCGSVLIRDYENIVFDNCKFINNSARATGGALSLDVGNAKITNCYFENNQGYCGGAIALASNWYHAKTEIINNLFINNQALGDILYYNENGKGGAIYSNCSINDSLYIISNTFHNNKYESYTGNGHDLGGAIYISESGCSGARYFYNNLFINNGCIESEDTPQPGDEFYIDDPDNNVYFYNNCIKKIPYNEPSYFGNNYIGWDEEDLLLADPSQNDLHLNYESPLIDIGMLATNSLDSLIYDLYANTDFDGNPRIVLDTIDVGCFEFFESGIYITQKEIDFGSVRHDRTSTQDLIIKNVGTDTTITNIEISFEESIAEYYTVDENDIPTEIASGDSACIPIEFCCHKMFVNCSGLMTITSSDPYMPEVQMLVYGSPALDNEWNWISFPALDRDENGNQDAEEVLDILVPNAHQLITFEKQILYNGNYWINNDLEYIVSTVGYKLEMFKDYSCYPFPIVGDSITIISPDTEIHLNAGFNWIGYWLPQSQNFDEAFGPDHFEKVLSIQAENWYYKPDPDPPEKDFPGQSQNIPSSFIHPLHYGRSYIVELSDSINLIWSDPTGGNTKERGYEETEAFSYDEKETYEVIDVIGLDETVLEIGVFNVNGECLGASKVDSLGSAQILTYTDTQTKVGPELFFCIYQGRDMKEIYDYLLYDFKANEFIKAALKSGERKYNLVLFDSANPQLLDRLILQQNTPNPFNFNHSKLEISYAIPKTDHISLKIYNIKGQLVKTLIDEDEKETGYYTVVWDGKDDHNRNVCNGVYLYKLENSDSSIIKKMIVLD